MELKWIKQVNITAQTFAFNRTILELKYLLDEKLIFWSGAFNRTILELKLRSVPCPSTDPRLLIEPYWNWKESSRSTYPPNPLLLIEPYWNWNELHLYLHMLLYIAFNRTILELKFHKKRQNLRPVQAFNRTILELKCDERKGRDSDDDF